MENCIIYIIMGLCSLNVLIAVLNKNIEAILGWLESLVLCSIILSQ